MIFAGKQLKDERMLDEYDSQDETTIYVVGRLCGGGGGEESGGGVIATAA